VKRLLLIVLVASCGGDDSNAQADASIDGPGSGSGSADASIDSPTQGVLTLTSPVLTEGGTIMAVNTCAGANTSPQLTWTGNTMNAQSFAIVFTDKSNNLVHWVIYDIPGSATGLPANVEKVYAPTNVAGAHQTLSYQNVRGYLGPCPPNTHTYEFAVYALSVATLPGASMTTTRAQAVPLIMQNDVAVATLTGTYTP
jgi:Raf kinase inhibitor-like YbhB/YbcL family protein